MRAIYDDCKIDILCIESHLECHLLYTDRGRGLNVGVFSLKLRSMQSKDLND